MNTIQSLLEDIINVELIFFFCLSKLCDSMYRKSSGFSRGVSKYRGVARY